MKSSKTEIHSRVHSLPEIRFDDQRLTSCSGLAVFQSHFQSLELRKRLRSCFSRGKQSGTYGMHTIFLVLVVHILIGYRKLRDLDYYKDDPMVMRVLGLRRLPEVSTISRALARCDETWCRAIDVEIARQVVDRLAEAGLSRITLDFDGSVCGTRRHAEGTAVGYNAKRKGERSYYPLICTVAQTGQVLGFLQRPGNVHDSHDSQEFMVECFDRVIGKLPQASLESRLDSAHFSEETASLLDRLGVEFTIAVPFSRLPALKETVENRSRWTAIDDTWSYFELEWAPKSWVSRFRFIVVRQRVPERQRGALQLDMFEPKEWSHDFKVVMTNKVVSAGAVLQFHHGRGSQEGTLGELKSDCQFDYIPVQHKLGNRLFAQATVMAHNVSRDLQIATWERDRATTPTRAAHWTFDKLSTLRNRIIRRAGRLTRPNGTLVLTMSANPAAREDILRYLAAS